MGISQPSRAQVARTAFVRFVAGFVVIAAMFLLPAGTVAYWQAWVYMAVLFTPVTLVWVYLLKNDPELLERRMRTKEKEPEQSLIIKLSSVVLLLAFVLPGFDRRFGWSYVPAVVVIVADVLVLLGYAMIFWVMRENTYASRIIEVEKEQHVITSGPYAIVRHPMYLGVLVMCFFTPVALGSWWALIPTVTLVPILVARIRREEQLLAKELKGYPEYMRTTRYRLIPGVW